MLAIEAANVRKVYSGWFGRRGAQTALAGLDIAIPRGTAFGLIGLNGAGKTTFIKIMLGVVRPTDGVVRVLGGNPEDPNVRRRIGYLPERLFLTSAFTPRQFLGSVARMKGLRLTESVLIAQLERVGLGPDTNRRNGGFSKGMRQRLGLAAALLGSPDLLILDEPTDGVDPLGRAEIRKILAEERARGATLFLNSHLLSETERVCDRIGILAAGKLVREGRLLDLCGSETAYRAKFAPGFNAPALHEIGFRNSEIEGEMRIISPTPEALNQALDAARSRGALIIGLARDLRDLEDVLAEALGTQSPQSESSSPPQPLNVHTGETRSTVGQPADSVHNIPSQSVHNESLVNASDLEAAL
ncbi:MAG: ABC transporter ATP-binding protein [Polyangiaceae bacterium]|nr:ABC transporter ATP-binding protein [Polyangiaceae bacterium]